MLMELGRNSLSIKLQQYNSLSFMKMGRHSRYAIILVIYNDHDNCICYFPIYKNILL